MGLGTNGGTPLGVWRVKNKLEDPTYYPPAGAKDKRIIAAGDPNIWTGIFLQNARYVGEHIDSLIDRLTQLRELITRQDSAELHAWLAIAKERRDRLE